MSKQVRKLQSSNGVLNFRSGMCSDFRTLDRKGRMETTGKKRKRSRNSRKKEERRKVAMGRFRENYELSEKIVDEYRPAKEAFTDILEMYTCKSEGTISRMITTCVGLTNTEDDAMQKCANYLSAITIYLPSLVKVVKRVLGMKGYGVIELDEKGLDANDIKLEAAVNMDKTAAIIGQLILILFKNINQKSYDTYIRKRAAALKAIVEYHGELIPGCDEDVLLNRESAEIISNVLGASCLLRSTIMHAVIANSKHEGSFGEVCGYVMGIAAWTKMNAIKHIFDAILAPKSPVLGVSRLAAEVLNLQEACMTINRTEYPQFFMIFHPTAATRVLENHRFANLTAIAKRIKAVDQASINNYVGVAGVDQAFVIEMTTLHFSVISKRQKGEVKRAEKYLPDINAHPELEDSESGSETEGED
ncbi:hypothetical protein CsatB_028156 [Cannabis sativa]